MRRWRAVYVRASSLPYTLSPGRWPRLASECPCLSCKHERVVSEARGLHSYGQAGAVPWTRPNPQAALCVFVSSRRHHSEGCGLSRGKRACGQPSHPVVCVLYHLTKGGSKMREPGMEGGRQRPSWGVGDEVGDPSPRPTLQEHLSAHRSKQAPNNARLASGRDGGAGIPGCAQRGRPIVSFVFWCSRLVKPGQVFVSLPALAPPQKQA